MRVRISLGCTGNPERCGSECAGQYGVPAIFFVFMLLSSLPTAAQR